MREEEFRVWMINLGTMGKRPIADAMSRCRRIVSGLGVDLDAEYLKDGGESLIELLEYTAEDERLGQSAPKGINFAKGANIKDGMASLRGAVRKYFEFCRCDSLRRLP